MTQPASFEKRFRGRRAEMAAIGYYLKGGEYGDQFFVSANRERIDAEDVLMADWQGWLRILQKAKANA